MIDVISLYEDAARDDANKEENGNLSYERFNRLLRRAEVSLLKFLTGDLVLNVQDFPVPNSVQKNKDYLKDFIVPFKANGNFTLPEDYFGYDNLYKIGSFHGTLDCDEVNPVLIEKCNTPIEILDGQIYYNRCNSFIKSLKPSHNKPIAKIVANKIEMMPNDIGSVCLEYVRYPKYGRVAWKNDTVYNDVIADPLASQNCEWGEWAREPLVWFIVNKYANHISNKSLKESNTFDKPRG